MQEKREQRFSCIQRKTSLLTIGEARFRQRSPYQRLLVTRTASELLAAVPRFVMRTV